MDENVRRNGHKPARRRMKPKWTVMVYLAGDNNLTANCISVLQQLEAVKYNEDVCVLACFDSNTPWPKGSRYLAINCKRRKVKNGLDWEIHNDLIIPKKRGHDLTTPDLCAPYKPARGKWLKHRDVAEGLERFVDWAMENHDNSDRRYMLILYGHGPVVAGQTFLARENPQSSLRLQDLPRILCKHFGPDRKLDILAFQNCVMNGIEMAYAMKDQVEYMVGSQGLVLSNGWPYEKIIGALVENSSESTLAITEKMLKACARNLIDFAVMDRSSEQSVCDISKLGAEPNIIGAVSELASALSESLNFKEVGDQKVLEYPAISDAIKLARLEAQAFWGESFVDISDFCERLLKKCNEAVRANCDLFRELGLDANIESQLRASNLVGRFTRIAECCKKVVDKVREMVPHSYYIGADLQYSHGVSIYFPWTMPGDPFFFLRRRHDVLLRSAFDIYTEYGFARDSGWGDFLTAFYCATLRKVRRAEREFRMSDVNDSLSDGIVRETIKAPAEVLTGGHMQKSGTNSGAIDHEVWSYVKNYPRRNYVSPSDCPRRVESTGRHRRGSGAYKNPDSPPISYLGWNICELVAAVITKASPPPPPPPVKGKGKQKVVPQQKAIPGRLRVAARAQLRRQP